MAGGIPESLCLVLTHIWGWLLVPTSQEPALTPSQSLTTIAAKMSFLQALITSGLIDNSIHGKRLRLDARQHCVRQTALSA